MSGLSDAPYDRLHFEAKGKPMPKNWNTDDLTPMDDAALMQLLSNARAVAQREKSKLAEPALVLIPLIEAELARRAASRPLSIQTERRAPRGQKGRDLKISISALYRGLGAPLRNSRWSWGAINHAKRILFLSVWEDEIKQHGERRLVRVTAHAELDPKTDYGYRERLNHLEAIRDGIKAFLIFCRPISTTDRRRSLSSINSAQLFPVISIEKLGIDEYLEFDTPVPRSDFNSNN